MSDVSTTRRKGGTTVLVVEDEFFIADDIRRGLSAAGFRVLGPVASIEPAFYEMERERPDVALLDVHVGRAKVSPVAVKLRELNIPYVLAAASPAHELAADPALAGALNLGKPTDLKRIVETICSLMV
ncbi:response regulator [Pararhizobium arenae]|uniref:response regulator n=1 Tax=Pararhizobium arenae TaxID=1856850 RepID=UPI00094AA578|nr:response regulator [Pararhizobium arenae]